MAYLVRLLDMNRGEAFSVRRSLGRLNASSIVVGMPGEWLGFLKVEMSTCGREESFGA